jgi:hypothetical protein
VGAGLFADLEEAMARCCRVQASFHPRRELRDTYDRLFSIYEELYPAVMPINQRLSALAQS